MWVPLASWLEPHYGGGVAAVSSDTIGDGADLAQGKRVYLVTAVLPIPRVGSAPRPLVTAARDSCTSGATPPTSSPGETNLRHLAQPGEVNRIIVRIRVRFPGL